MLLVTCYLSAWGSFKYASFLFTCFEEVKLAKLLPCGKR